jgi:hypothetical protein
MSKPGVGGEPRRRRLVWIWAATAAGAVLAAPLLVRLGDLLPACALRSLTGLPCPTCGSLRALRSLAAGKPLEAASQNPLFTIAALLFVAGGLLAPVWVRAERRRPWTLRMDPRVGWALVLAAVLLQWVYLWRAGVALPG